MRTLIIAVIFAIITVIVGLLPVNAQDPYGQRPIDLIPSTGN